MPVAVIAVSMLIMLLVVVIQSDASPARPPVGEKGHPGRREQRGRHRKIQIEPQRLRGPENGNSNYFFVRSRELNPQKQPELVAECVPKADRENAPQDRRQNEYQWTRKERYEHLDPQIGLWSKRF
jgi:hypothetical protein